MALLDCASIIFGIIWKKQHNFGMIWKNEHILSFVDEEITRDETCLVSKIDYYQIRFIAQSII